MIDNSLFNYEYLINNYYPKVVAYYFRDWNNFDMTAHRHDQVEIMYVLTGQCSVRINDRDFLMSKGDFVLIDANVSHSLKVKFDEHCRMLNIEFIFEKEINSSYCIKELLSKTDTLKFFLSRKLPYTFLKDNEELYQLLRSLILELDEQSLDSSYMIRFYIYQILIKIGRLFKEAEESDGGVNSPYIKKVIRYMNDNYDSDITIEEVASQVNLHPTYLQRIFKRGTGETLMEYLQHIRVNKAKMLLLYTDIPIIDISNYVGINSRQHFSYVFKKYTGYSPKQYRKATDKSNIRL